MSANAGNRLIAPLKETRWNFVNGNTTMAKIHSFLESHRFQIKLLKFRIIELSSKINTLNKFFFFFLNMRNCYHSIIFLHNDGKYNTIDNVMLINLDEKELAYISIFSSY